MNKHTSFYPLRFHPIFRRYIWGGRRLGTELNKAIGDGNDYAESWEVVDHGEDQSVVQHGKLAGRTLSELIQSDPVEMLGLDIANAISNKSLPTALRNRFPLLLKFLDANSDLSVQVHPTDAQGQSLSPPDLGKTEAWLVMDVAPGSKIYAGLKAGIDRIAFEKAIRENCVEETLHSFTPSSGDCIFIPAGTVHAIGAGLLVAEIQQSSDTTFRLFDWNRTDSNGKSRELHIAAGVDAINFDFGPVHPIPTTGTNDQSLIQCEKFSLQRHRFSDPYHLQTKNKFQLIAILQGKVKVVGDPCEKPLSRGETLLIPACLESVQLTAMGNTEAEIILANA